MDQKPGTSIERRTDVLPVDHVSSGGLV
jgi:hypothetical protein